MLASQSSHKLRNSGSWGWWRPISSRCFPEMPTSERGRFVRTPLFPSVHCVRVYNSSRGLRTSVFTFLLQPATSGAEGVDDRFLLQGFPFVFFLSTGRFNYHLMSNGKRDTLWVCNDAPAPPPLLFSSMTCAKVPKDFVGAHHRPFPQRVRLFFPPYFLLPFEQKMVRLIILVTPKKNTLQW
jgi:hypothetical protein